MLVQLEKGVWHVAKACGQGHWIKVHGSNGNGVKGHEMKGHGVEGMDLIDQE